MEWGRERVGIPGRAQARAAEGGVQLCLHLSFHRRDKTGPKEAAREPGQPQTQEGWVGLHDLRAPCTCPASAASKMSGVTAHSPGKNSPGAGGRTVAGLLDVWPPRSLERLSGTSAVQSNNLQPGAGKRPAQGHRTLASVTPCSTVDPRRGRKTGPGYTATLSQAPPLSIIIAMFSELSPVLPCGAAGRGGIGLCPHDAHPRNNRNGDSSHPPSTQRVPGTS